MCGSYLHPVNNSVGGPGNDLQEPERVKMDAESLEDLES